MTLKLSSIVERGRCNAVFELFPWGQCPGTAHSLPRFVYISRSATLTMLKFNDPCPPPVRSQVFAILICVIPKSRLSLTERLTVTPSNQVISSPHFHSRATAKQCPLSNTSQPSRIMGRQTRLSRVDVDVRTWLVSLKLYFLRTGHPYYHI